MRTLFLAAALLAAGCSPTGTAKPATPVAATAADLPSAVAPDNDYTDHMDPFTLEDGKAGGFPRMAGSQLGRDTPMVVDRIVSGTELVVKATWSEPPQGRVRVYVSGVSTKGLVDGKPVMFPGTFVVDGTKKGNSGRTIFAIHPK